jgi:hypothetical protein
MDRFERSISLGSMVAFMFMVDIDWRWWLLARHAIATKQEMPSWRYRRYMATASRTSPMSCRGDVSIQ